MKRVIYIILLVYLSQPTYGQDKIITKDKTELDVLILEKNEKEVKFKRKDFIISPILGMNSENIRKIIYQNGLIDLMGYENPRKNRPFGLSFGTIFPLSEIERSLYTGTLDYFITPQIDVELNVGLDLSDSYYYSVGSRFHLNSNYSKKRITPFIGILAGSYTGISFVQLPIGLSYISNFGLQSSLSFNQLQYLISTYQLVFLEFRLGWRFKN
jgi:hypothetical protein